MLMDNCCIVEKEYEENTWLFVKLGYEQHELNFLKYSED